MGSSYQGFELSGFELSGVNKWQNNLKGKTNLVLVNDSQLQLYHLKSNNIPNVDLNALVLILGGGGGRGIISKFHGMQFWDESFL